MSTTTNLGRVKMMWRGAYSSATAYEVDDAVSYNGSSYICIANATGQVPTNTTYWDILASKGSIENAEAKDILYNGLTSGLSADDVQEAIDEIVSDLGTASSKDSTSVVTDSTDLVESGAVKDLIGWGNKNLFDTSAITQTSVVLYRSIYVGDGNFTCSTTAPKNQNDSANLFFLAGNVQEGAVTQYNGVWNGQTRTVTAINGYVTVGTRSVDGVDIANYNNQIEKGSTATAYEPYHASVEETLRDAEVIQGKNLFDYSRLVNGTIDSNGEDVASSGSERTDYYIPINSNSTYVFSGILNLVRLHYYNSNKIYLGFSTSVLVDKNNPFTTPVNSAYLRISSNAGFMTSSMQLEEGSQVTDFQPYYTPLKDVVPTKANSSALGTVENGTNASKSYAIGEHFSRFGDFCTVTQPIASGGTLTEGTNYSVQNIEEVIKSINDKLKYYNIRLSDVPNTGTVADKCTNVANQLDALITEVGVKFTGYVLWTSSMFLRVEAIRCNSTTLLFTIFNASYTIYQGNVANGTVNIYKIEGGNIS